MLPDDPPRDNLEAATALAAALGASPPRCVVVSPGARNAPLVLAMQREPGLILHVVLDERAAAFVALGLAMAQNRAAVLVCTSGSAGGHYLPAVMEACHAHVPLIAITADRPAELHHLGAPQTTRQDALFGAHLRGGRTLPTPCAQPAVAQAWAAQGAWAVHLAQGSRPGPVHLNAPFREPLLPSPESMAPVAPVAAALPMPRRLGLRPPLPDDGELDKLCAWLVGRRAGVVVCGPLGLPGSSDALPNAVRALAQRLGWPLLADVLSNVRRGDGHGACVVDCYDGLIAAAQSGVGPGEPPICDGVLRLGDLPTSKRLRRWLARPNHPEVLLAHALGCGQDPDHTAAVVVEADLLALCQALLARLPPAAAPSAHSQAWAAWNQAGQRRRALLAQSDAPLWAGNLWPTLWAAVPQNAVLHVGSSMPVRDLDTYAAASAQAPMACASRGLNGIDGAVATLTGELLADTRPRLAVMGDLTFLHDVGALQAARQLGVRGTVVVCHNGGGDIFRHLPLAQHVALADTYFRTPQLADLGALARACGSEHTQVATAANLSRAVAASLAPAAGRASGLHIIEAAMGSAEAMAAEAAAWRSPWHPTRKDLK